MKLFLLLLYFICALVHAEPYSIQVTNTTQDKILLEKNSHEIRSIASVTKLMTAMVYLDIGNNLDYKINLINKVKTYLPKQAYSRRDLLNAMLVKSDNAAAETLANDFLFGRDAFIEAMNEKAKSIGMHNTSFTDASGLNKTNISTANDIAKMLTVAQTYPFILETSIKKETEIETYNKKKVKNIIFKNTNYPLLNTFNNIIISKTGYTTPAGFCVAFIVNNGKDIFTVVILGSKNLKERLNVAKNLITDYILKE